MDFSMSYRLSKVGIYGPKPIGPVLGPKKIETSRTRPVQLGPIGPRTWRSVESKWMVMGRCRGRYDDFQKKICFFMIFMTCNF